MTDRDSIPKADAAIMDAASQRVVAFVDRLISEGEGMLHRAVGVANRAEYSSLLILGAGPSMPTRVFSDWTAQIRQLAVMLGPAAKAWHESLTEKRDSTQYEAEELLGVLSAISTTIRAGLLLKVEDFVLADAFDGLLEQADYLQSKGFHDAAAVLARAVLEEHLRRWCQREALGPGVERPTAEIWNQTLYKSGKTDKVTMQHVTAMLAVGNSAAHQNPKPEAAHVARMLSDARRFLIAYPLGAIGQ